jgi:hypothetical protein
MAEAIVAKFLQHGGMMGAALVAVVWYLMRRLGDIDRLYSEKQEMTEKIYKERLLDHEMFRKTVLDLNQTLVAALTRSTDTAESMAETIDTIRERLDDVYRIVLPSGERGKPR